MRPAAGRLQPRLDPVDCRLVPFAALQTIRPTGRGTAALAAAVVVAEATGLVVRLTCRPDGCGGAGWARRLDMDALGSVPRALVTLLLAAVAVTCLRAVWRAGRQGAAVWWAVLAAGTALLAAAKQWSVHSVLEQQLDAVLPDAGVQVLFVLVSAVGLTAAVVSGRWVRRDTRTPVVVWLALYAVAAVGLAAVTVALAPLGDVVAAGSTFVEETGEGLAAVGLLAAVQAGVRAVAQRAEVATRSWSPNAFRDQRSASRVHSAAE